MYSVAVMKDGELRIVEIPKPVPGPYDAVVKTEASFICNATDRKIIDRHFPGMDIEQYPVLLGHESVGIVEQCGERVATFRPGDRVIGGLLLEPPGGGFNSGWGGHSEYVLVRDHPAMTADGVADAEHGWDEIYRIMRPVPKDISIEAAGLLCTWREVYSGMFTDFRLKEGDNIVVFGAGPVGLSFVRFGRLKGLGKIISIDRHESKRARALALGADEAYAPDDPAVGKLKELNAPGFDAVVDAVGNESIIRTGVKMIRMGGSICVFGVVGAPEIRLNKADGPYNFNLMIHQWPTRDAEAASQENIVEWLREGKLRHEDFVTGVFTLENINDAVAAVSKSDSIKTMIIFQ